MLSGVGARPPSVANSPIHVVPMRLTSGTSPPAMAVTMLVVGGVPRHRRHLDADVGELLHEGVGEDAEVVALGAHRPHA